MWEGAWSSRWSQAETKTREWDFSLPQLCTTASADLIFPAARWWIKARTSCDVLHLGPNAENRRKICQKKTHTFLTKKKPNHSTWTTWCHFKVDFPGCVWRFCLIQDEEQKCSVFCVNHWAFLLLMVQMWRKKKNCLLPEEFCTKTNVFPRGRYLGQKVNFCIFYFFQLPSVSSSHCRWTEFIYLSFCLLSSNWPVLSPDNKPASWYLSETKSLISL